MSKQTNPDDVFVDGVRFSKDRTVLVDASNYRGVKYHLPDGTEYSSYNIPEGTEAIGEDAFEYNEHINRLTMPTTLEHIGDSAFWNCRNLAYIKFSKKISIITPGLFYRCRNIEAFDVDKDNVDYSAKDGILYNQDKTVLVMCPPKRKGILNVIHSTKIIERSAFRYCNELENIILPPKLEEIHSNAFEDCDKLTKIRLPGSVHFLGSDVFENCPKLTDIEVFTRNKTYKSINGVLFEKEHSYDPETPLTLIKYPEGKTPMDGTYVVPDNVIAINSWGFAFCKHMQKIILSKNIIRIGASAFHSNQELTDVIIPNNIEIIPHNLFNNCLKLVNVVLGNRVHTIELRAFDGCKSLRLFDIPKSVTKLQSNVFSSCDNLRAVKISQQIEEIGNVTKKDGWWTWANYLEIKKEDNPGYEFDDDLKTMYVIRMMQLIDSESDHDALRDTMTFLKHFYVNGVKTP